MQGISKADDSMTKQIHKMFKLGRIINHYTCRDKVQILYPNLDLSRMLSPEKDVNKLLTEIDEVALEDKE